jgi:hypothetical protein
LATDTAQSGGAFLLAEFLHSHDNDMLQEQKRIEGDAYGLYVQVLHHSSYIGASVV